MIKNSKEPDFNKWLQEGLTNGFVGPAICYPHDGLPLTIEEDEDFDNGGDPCIHILRLYEDEETKLAVEENHSPSVWRATNSNFKL
jgi:hypothetical protein